MEYLEKYNEWLNNKLFDKDTKKELMEIKENDQEIKDRFYKDLEFGTAGLRGIMGAGTNRMNKYTVTKATQGLANYILKQAGENKGVAIAFDSRNMSPEFSEQAALCLNANGIKTYRFNTLRPTPELSYAVRKLGCIAGIVITASHNPPEYNGYKVYWEDGAQIVAPKDKEIIEEVNKVKDYAEIKYIEKQEAIEKGLFNEIGENIDESYMQELEKLVLNNFECSKYYTKNNWFPHCTLAIRLSDDELKKGLNLLKENNMLPLKVRCEKVDILDYSNKPNYKQIEVFEII